MFLLIFYFNQRKTTSEENQIEALGVWTSQAVRPRTKNTSPNTPETFIGPHLGHAEVHVLPILLLIKYKIVLEEIPTPNQRKYLPWKNRLVQCTRTKMVFGVGVLDSQPVLGKPL